MDWSRAKTILIICLFAVNVFLFGTYMAKENESRAEKARLRAEVCKVLSSQGIMVDEKTIPDDSMRIGHATVKICEDPGSVAGALFGGVSMVSSQGNVVYSAGNGNIMFSGDSFSLIYESGTEIRSEAEAVALAASIAKKLGVETNEKRFESASEEGGYSVSIPQIFGGVLVYGSDIELKISASGSVLGNGEFIGQGKLLRAEGEALEVSALLFEFADIVRESGKKRIYISDIQYGYSVKHHAAGMVYLAPTLKISTDDGIFYVNMEDGKLRELN